MQSKSFRSLGMINESSACLIEALNLAIRQYSFNSSEVADLLKEFGLTCSIISEFTEALFLLEQSAIIENILYKQGQARNMDILLELAKLHLISAEQNFKRVLELLELIETELSNKDINEENWNSLTQVAKIQYLKYLDIKMLIARQKSMTEESWQFALKIKTLTETAEVPVAQCRKFFYFFAIKEYFDEEQLEKVLEMKVEGMLFVEKLYSKYNIEYANFLVSSTLLSMSDLLLTNSFKSLSLARTVYNTLVSKRKSILLPTVDLVQGMLMKIENKDVEYKKLIEKAEESFRELLGEKAILVTVADNMLN